MVTIEKLTHILRDNINNFKTVSKSNMTSIESLKYLFNTSITDWSKYKNILNDELQYNKNINLEKTINDGYIDGNNSYYNNFSLKKIEGDRNSWYYRMKLPYAKDTDIFSLYLIKWLPFSKSYIHNHEDMGCLFKILDGEIEEKIFDSDNFTIQDVNEYSNITLFHNNKNKIGYIDDNIGLHSIHNNTNKDVYSLHLYAKRYSRELHKYSHHNFSLIKYFPFG